MFASNHSYHPPPKANNPAHKSHFGSEVTYNTKPDYIFSNKPLEQTNDTHEEYQISTGTRPLKKQLN